LVPPRKDSHMSQPMPRPVPRRFSIEGTHWLARAMVLKHDGEGTYAVLLAQEIGAGHTFLPGGHIEPEEGVIQALRRELREELGVESRIGAYLGAVEAQWPDDDPRHYEMNHVFVAEAALPPEGLVSREPHLRFFWCPLTQLDEHNLSPSPLRHLIRGYAAGDTRTWWATTIADPTAPVRP
jgi:8-oxo-dGTP diphosphatase